MTGEYTGNNNSSSPQLSEDESGNVQSASYLDYTGDQVSDKEDRPVLGAAYDPRPQEDGARRMIAYLLIGLLWVIVGGMLILLSFGAFTVADIKEFGVLLSPVVTLVSAATGFYYGTKSSSG